MATAYLFPELIFNDNTTGSPLAGGEISTYAAGTFTPVATYTDNTALTSVGVSIPLDANGRPNSGNGIWLLSGSQYKFIIKDSNGATVQTIDNIDASGLAGAGAALFPTYSSQTAATYTMVGADKGKHFVFTTQTTSTISLTAAATLGDGWFCYINNFNSGIMTIDPAGAELINSASTTTLTSLGSGMLICSGTAFYFYLMPVTSSSTAFLPSISATGSIAASTSISATTSVSATTYVKSTSALRTGYTSYNVTGNTNNLANGKDYLYLTSTGAYDLTGIVPDSTTDFQRLVISNISANTITLKHNSGSSSANNKFFFSPASDITLTTGQSKQFFYSPPAGNYWININ